MPYATSLLNGSDNAATTLVASGGLAAGATSIVVASATGFPTAPFAIGLGVYTTRYEEVIVTSVAGTTWTLQAATAKAHVDGETVENTIGAEVLKRLGDLGLQHTHQGSADGTVLTDATVPVTQAFGDAAATGSAAALARRDHKHGMPANPTPAFATPAIALGTAAAAGAAGTVIRSDATIVAFDTTSPANVNYGGAAVVGSAAFAARRDHVHALQAIALGNLPTAPEAHLSRSVAQSISNNAWNILSFDVEYLDNDTIHDLVTNIGRLTCKTAGRYLIWGQVHFANNATNCRALGLFRNSGGTGGGGFPLTVDARQAVAGVTGFGTALSVSRIMPLAVNDYVELHAFQDSGAALNINYVDLYTPQFGMRWLGA